MILLRRPFKTCSFRRIIGESSLRHNKNDHWGDTTDERRVGSCERASEEYQIMGGFSRKQAAKDSEQPLKRLVSPSPEASTQNRYSQSSTTQSKQRKSSTTANATQYLNQQYISHKVNKDIIAPGPSSS
jgi:protein tyrosine phosphatase